MKTKVLLMSLIGLLFLFTVTYKAYSACGYYFSWYPSCEGEDCDDSAGSWDEGTGIEECSCESPGAWEYCWEEQHASNPVCYTVWYILENCDDLLYHGYSPQQKCKGW